jgi:hypothetical protein
MKRRSSTGNTAADENRHFYEQIPPEVWCVHVLRKLDVTSIYRFAAASRYFLAFADGGVRYARWIGSAVVSLGAITERYRRRLHQGQHQLEHLCINNDLVQRFANLLVLELDDDVCCITDEALSRLRHLRALNLGADSRITDKGLCPLTQLRVLELGEHPNVSDASIASLTQLAHLDLGWNTRVTDAGLAPLRSSLQILNLSHNGGGVTDGGLVLLTALTQLSLDNNSHISDAALCQPAFARHLTSLSLAINRRITDAALSCLTALVKLALACSPVTDRGLAPLTRLQQLRLNVTSGVSGRVFGRLTQLRSLALRFTGPLVTDDDIAALAATLRTLELGAQTPGITDRGLSQLTGLRSLSLLKAQSITDAALRPLTALTRLQVLHNDHVTPSGLSHLCALRTLDYQHCAQLLGAAPQLRQLLPVHCAINHL